MSFPNPAMRCRIWRYLTKIRTNSAKF